MPGFDRTGPAGQGPMTGGGRGLCNLGRRVYGSYFGSGDFFGRGGRRGRFFGKVFGPRIDWDRGFEGGFRRRSYPGRGASPVG